MRITETDHHLRIAVGKRSLWFKIGGTAIALAGCFIFGAVAAANVGLIPSEEGTSITGFLACCALTSVMIYGLLAVWLNGTILDVTRQTIQVFVGPLPVPWAKSRSYETSGIAQLFVQEVRHTAGSDDDWVPGYEVWCLFHTSERVELIDLGEATGWRWGKRTRLPAEEIEERIESFLEIENVPVELRKVTRVHAPSNYEGGVPSN